MVSIRADHKIHHIDRQSCLRVDRLADRCSAVHVERHISCTVKYCGNVMPYACLCGPAVSGSVKPSGAALGAEIQRHALAHITDGESRISACGPVFIADNCPFAGKSAV